VTSPEYLTWAEQNYIIVDRAELNPKGVMAYAEEIRAAFAPIVKTIRVDN
jgi:hypothetical protein